MLQGSHACINDICLIGSSVGYISTNYYTYKTTNGGLGWNRIDCPANKLFFINDKIGWASQYSSILKTTDGGLRWIYQDIGITDRVDDIFFTDANNGWGTGYPDTYIYTNDGGSHWYQKYLNNDHDISRIYSLYFIDSNTGWIAGSTNNYDTIILKTNDGGKSWADCTVPGSSAYIACIYFLDAENGWAVGSGIWHTSSGGTSTTLRDISLNEDVYPEAFYLKQNYPNPFNDETLIEYGIPEKCNVNVKVFDIHGSQIIKIKDAMENAGNYTIKWDGKNGSNQSIPSGIYLCRIQAGKYQKTLRMLLLK
jgi:hypothetical protein